jgi:hypothetical protein
VDFDFNIPGREGVRIVPRESVTIITSDAALYYSNHPASERRTGHKFHGEEMPPLDEAFERFMHFGVTTMLPISMFVRPSLAPYIQSFEDGQYHDSCVPGIMAAYAKGNVTLANGVGNGVADDKAVYPYVPDLIRFFLDEEPLLGQVETFICARPEECGHVLANLDKLVVKAVDEAGGYGMLIGPQASKKEIADFAARIAKHPRKYIAQPRIELSTSPTWTGESTAPRRVDLRPYVVSGRTRWVLPGGLSRVALREGSYVVNSSQGGGSKDTWVLDVMETGA